MKMLLALKDQYFAKALPQLISFGEYGDTIIFDFSTDIDRYEPFDLIISDEEVIKKYNLECLGLNLLLLQDTDCDLLRNHFFLKIPFHYSKLFSYLNDISQIVNSTLKLSRLSIKQEDRVIIKDGTITKDSLTEKEFSLLKYLIKYYDVSVSRGQVLYNVWGYKADIETRTLETHVYTLRQKLEKYDETIRIEVENNSYRIYIQ